MDRDPLSPDFTLLQVVPRLDGGGVEAVTLEIGRAVAAAGARSLVASRGGALEGRLALEGSALVRLPMDSRSPPTLVSNALRLARIIRGERVSLVHVRSRAPAFSALWAARAARVPIVATYHGIYASGSPVKRWYNGVMTRGDLTIANSDFTHRHVLAEHRIDPERLAVAPEGVDTDEFDPAQVSPERVAAQRAAWGLAADGEFPVVLQAARLTGWKGQGVMIEALRLTDPGRRITLVLAGRPEGRGGDAALRDAAAAAGLADRVRIVGPAADMPAAYLAADVVVAPSIAAESFGRAVVEACAMARPVIASDLGASAETVADGESGWLAPPGDAPAWARMMEAVLDLPAATRRQIGAKARARAIGLYSLPAMCAAHFALYRDLVEGRR
jgi:glycosyltransferase involved in cell wall biosynthesis